MEAVLLRSSLDHPVSPYRRIKNPRKNNRNFTPSSNLFSNTIHGGLFGPPPSLSSSFPYNPQQPPLLPLPITKPYSSAPCRNRGLSSSPTNRKISTIRDQNLASKKQKPSSISPKKQETTRDSGSIATSSKCLVVASTDRLGPDPSNLPKEVSMVLKQSSTTMSSCGEEFSGSVFALSPPPSSLPLPKFSMKAKLSCNVENGGIDAGATDNLRRLLRLP